MDNYQLISCKDESLGLSSSPFPVLAGNQVVPVIQGIIDTLPQASIILDIEGNILFSNSEADIYLADQNPEFQYQYGKSIFHCFSNVDLEKFSLLFHRCLKRKQNVNELSFSDQTLRVQTLTDRDQCVLLLTIFTEQRVDNNEYIRNPRLLELSQYDQLTGLPNRSFFVKNLKHLTETENAIAVLFIDLDNFKRINDSYGHEVGDVLLQQVAGRLKQCCRERDTVARLGDDEFSILFRLDQNKGISPEKFSQRIVQSMHECFHINGKSYYTSVSIGIALFPEDGAAVDSLVRYAALAMDEAKRKGKNTLKLFNKDLHKNVVRRNEIEEKLRMAINDNELSLHYQPITNLKSGQVIGMEALTRWFPEEGKPVSPAEFVPIAEESNLILKLDNWVMEQSIRMLRDLKERGYPELYISINVSSKHFVEPGLAADLKHLLEKYQVTADKLVIEITEHRLMENIDVASQVMRNLVKLGVKICIDDFGTGHSSLSYLRNFPVSSLKIDKCFIDNLWYGEGDITILNSIIGLGKSLGLKMTAEGVETETQLMFLKTRGCDYMQGYYYSPPLPQGRLYKLLQSKRTL